MTASRGSYEVSLVSEKDSQWKEDKFQKYCYVCTKVKLSRGKRHHCRLCGNISCHNCCPRICKKCLAENISSNSSSSSSFNDETIGQIQRLCKLKSQQIAWKKVEMIDKIYYEPVFIIDQDATKICIIRNVDGDYYAVHKDILFAAPEKQNILDSLQCLLHALINRSNESSISLKKALYALQDDNNNITTSDKILKRCQIFSFYPMLQKECYKLQGFIFKSSLNKMNLNNVQLFHFVSDEESPKKIPAYTATNTVNQHTNNDEKQSNYNQNDNVIISANSRRKSADSLKKKNMAILELELDSFKKGYQEMRKMYEEYVSANEAKQKEDQETIERLQNEVEDLSQSKAKYKQAVDINANQVKQLQQQLNILSSEYQNKLDAQSNKYKDSTQKTTSDAQAKLIESYKNMEEANNKIRNMEEEIEALKTLKTSNKMDQVNEFRLEKEQERCKKLEIKLQKLQEVQASREFNDKNNEDNEHKNENNNNNNNNYNIRDKIGREFNELFSSQHKELFDLLFSLILSYRSTWNKQYLYPLIYELLFNVLLESFKLINKFEKTISLTLCTQLSINKEILYESFYNEWIKNSNYEIFLHSTEKIKDIKNHLIDEIFIKQFIFKYLNLSSHQISEQIHLKFAEFIEKCINISWQMSIQYPMLRFTPNTFNVVQLNKIKFHKDLHNIYHGENEDINENINEKQFILYYIWPIISHNNFHSIVDDIKIQVCLGGSMPNKINSDNINGGNNNDIDASDSPDVEDNDDDDSLGMVIFDHDDNNQIIGDDDSYYDHQQDEY